MNTKNTTGRSIAILASVWFIGKSLLNMIISLLSDGGIDFVDLIRSALEAAVLVVGLIFTNYIVAAVLVIVVLMNIGNNLSHLFDGFKFIIYLAEGVIDVIAAIVLCAAPSVREHCSNTPAEVFGGGNNNGSQ